MHLLWPLIAIDKSRLKIEAMKLRACSSKGRIVILGRIVSASGQIFRSDFRPQDEIFRPGMPFFHSDEQAHSGNFQYKKSHFGKKWPKIDQNCENKTGFYHYKHSFSPEWSISINKIPL